MDTPKIAKEAELEKRIASLSDLVEAQGVFISSLGEILSQELPEIAVKLSQEMEIERERICGPMGEKPERLFLEIGLLRPSDPALQPKKGS